MTPDNQDRRHFPRIDYRADGNLITTRKKWPVHIMDISCNGVLAAVVHDHNIKRGEEVILNIQQEDGKSFKMQGHITRQDKHLLGVECRANGIAPQAELKKMLEKYRKQENHPHAVIAMIDLKKH